jgi:hypothetical protein
MRGFGICSFKFIAFCLLFDCCGHCAPLSLASGWQAIGKRLATGAWASNWLFGDWQAVGKQLFLTIRCNLITFILNFRKHVVF